MPARDRRQAGASLRVNPYGAGHILLGGVFRRAFPLKAGGQSGGYDHFWIWHEDSEQVLLTKIYRYFLESWHRMQDKSPDQADLILVGTGISRVDVPFLFCRCALQGVAPRAELFEVFFKAKSVDLSDVGIGLAPPSPLPYPLSTRHLLRLFGRPGSKESGMRVWDMYDGGDFPGIETRTEGEVRDICWLYSQVPHWKGSEKKA